jgi:glycosyltransferase involved in cell wall biosynthesis
MRVGFTLIGRQPWIGGYNYLLNLFRALGKYAPDEIEPVLFVGNDSSNRALNGFKKILNGNVIVSHLFDHHYYGLRITRSLILGKDNGVERVFKSHGVDVVPDFQHRHLPDMFSTAAYWKRELGILVQILSGRTIMLSSKNAKYDCEKFYPFAKGRTFLIPFAVEFPPDVLAKEPAEIKEQYQLPKDFIFLPNQFWKHKNHEVVIKAMRILKDRGKNILVAASGQIEDPRHPQYYDNLQELVRVLKITEHFRFLGMIPYEDLIGLMRASIAVINSSLFEGWSTTVEEAKSLGVPLILSDIPVHHEQAKESAFFFDPTSPVSAANAIEIALDTCKPGPRLQQEEIAASAAVNRSRAFVRDFEEVLRITREKNCKSNRRKTF